MLIVQKYGGSSLADARKIQQAAARVAGLAMQGCQMVVVVSAQGDTTDEMIQRSTQVNKRGSVREMDAYLSAGEQMSAALFAMAVDGTRIFRELGAGNVVVVAGFQGLADNGDVTTLGRGGSDTTAVALAGYLKADRCQIFTDVDGVYDRDPRKYPDAVRFGRISYEKMLRLIGSGAQVLHDRSVELAREFGIKVEVLSSFTGNPGTIVG